MSATDWMGTTDELCAGCGGPLETVRALLGFDCLACYHRSRTQTTSPSASEDAA